MIIEINLLWFVFGCSPKVSCTHEAWAFWKLMNLELVIGSLSGAWIWDQVLQPREDSLPVHIGEKEA